MALDVDPARTWPDAARVARRALALAAVVCRSTIEDDGATPEAESLRQSVVAWLAEVGADVEVTEAEWSLLHAPLGALEPERRLDGTWRGETLVVLAWALGLAELPAHDRQANPFALAQALGFHHPRERTVLEAPRLRTRDELITMARTLSELERRLHLQIRLAEGSAEGESSVAPPDGVPDGELLVRGLSLSSVPEPVRRALLRMAAERAKAASWLIARDAA